MRIAVVDQNHLPLMPTTAARARKIRWTAEEDTLILSLYGKERLQTLLSRLPGRTRCAVNSRAKTLKVKGNIGASQSIYSHDVDFFAIDSLASCYFAGFIAADGCVYPPRKTIKITVHSKDRSVLERFKAASQFTGEIRDHCSTGYRIDSNHSTLQICNAQKWIIDLESRFNIVQAKTKILQPPKLEGDRALAFITGYLDGDGSIFKVGNQTVVSFRGTESLLEWIKLFADSIAVSSWTPATVRTYSSGIGEYRIQGKRAEAFILQLSRLDIQKLDRKWSLP